MACVLDFYRVKWEYEPRTFVLAQAADGLPTSAFTPDFYLPDYDVYLEVTTLSQKLVTRKNRKARQAMAQHPGVTIRIVYQRDYLELLVRFGLEPPSQLSHVLRPRRARAVEPVGLLGLSPSQVPTGKASEGATGTIAG